MITIAYIFTIATILFLVMLFANSVKDETRYGLVGLSMLVILVTGWLMVLDILGVNPRISF